MPFNGTVDEEEFCELPPLLTGREVTAFLEQFGFFANTPLDWQKGPFPELRISIAGHSSSGRHVFYNVECTLWRASHVGQSQSGYRKDAAVAQPWLVWRASRRLAHIRQGLHDLVKHHLGSSYKTYFCRVPFAQRFRPAGTTERLNNWCRRLAYCLSSRLVPPIVAANALRVLGAPNLKDSELPGVDFFLDSIPPTEIPEEGAESLTTRSMRSSEGLQLSSPIAAEPASGLHLASTSQAQVSFTVSLCHSVSCFVKSKAKRSAAEPPGRRLDKVDIHLPGLDDSDCDSRSDSQCSGSAAHSNRSSRSNPGALG
ncbi:ABCG24 [Symbiodinium natans]|uniref:ABCG24 protein n=1 Tax=Symbiodinium natans TaxID=878477 RepID=A0A812RQM7_9DINO|nr:ABCG24 [Symbiodinium natans]